MPQLDCFSERNIIWKTLLLLYNFNTETVYVFEIVIYGTNWNRLSCTTNTLIVDVLEPLLVASRINFNPSMDKYLHSLYNVGWNYSSQCGVTHLMEQIIAYVRRIVQIMIQATDLVQILYRGHSSRKKRGPRKISIWPPFSNMAALGYHEILFFALKGQQMVEKANYDNEFYVLTIANVQIML